MNDVTVEKICCGKSETRKIKDCQPGDVIKALDMNGTYVLLGNNSRYGDPPIVSKGGFTYALHIIEKNGSSAPLRLACIDAGYYCTIVGRLRKLQWSSL